MKNIALQISLNEERLGRIGIWKVAEYVYDIHLGVADKWLIISQLRDYNDTCDMHIRKGLDDTLDRFQYTSIKFEESKKDFKEYCEKRAKRALKGEADVIA